MNLFNLLAPLYEYVHRGAAYSVRNLEKLAVFRSTNHVLDIGGGTGRVAQFFVRKVAEMVVLDVSPGMIRRCKRKSGLVCLEGSVEHIPYGDAYFDKIIIVDAFHHFARHEDVVQEVRRVLKPGGHVLIEEFNLQTVGGRLIAFLERILGMNSTFYTPIALQNLWQQYGFTAHIIDGKKITFYLKILL